MNRRLFIQRFTAGVVGAAVLAHIPASLIKAAPRLAEPARLWACERLRTAYHAYSNAHGGGMQSLPAGFQVGRQFFELYEVELPVNWRFVPYEDARAGPRFLMFKGCRVYVSKSAVAYECQAVGIIDLADMAA